MAALGELWAHKVHFFFMCGAFGFQILADLNGQCCKLSRSIRTCGCNLADLFGVDEIRADLVGSTVIPAALVGSTVIPADLVGSTVIPANLFRFV